MIDAVEFFAELGKVTVALVWLSFLGAFLYRFWKSVLTGEEDDNE